MVSSRHVSGRKFCSRSCFYANGNLARLTGSRNGNWRGGRAVYYGPGWKAIKQQVRERDQLCRECGKSPGENGRALDVHHIEPFRFSGNNSMSNLVALCRSCHMRADDHGRRGSAAFLAAAGYPKMPTKREIRDQRASQRAAVRRDERREAQAHALELAELGLSLRRIARAVGVSHQTIANWLPPETRQERLVS